MSVLPRIFNMLVLPDHGTEKPEHTGDVLEVK